MTTSLMPVTRNGPQGPLSSRNHSALCKSWVRRCVSKYAEPYSSIPAGVS
jgi:hypothetical protein